MTHHTAPRIPNADTAAYRAADHLSKSGPLTIRELFAAVHFSVKPSTRLDSLNTALRTGWLVEVGGKIDIGSAAREHFADAEPVKPIGQIATVRDQGSVYERKPWKSNLNSQGNRPDIPQYSVREGQSFRSVPTGDRS